MCVEEELGWGLEYYVCLVLMKCLSYMLYILLVSQSQLEMTKKSKNLLYFTTNHVVKQQTKYFYQDFDQTKT